MKILLALSSFLLALPAYSQTKESRAFSKSYELEYTKNYAKAIEVLEKINSKSSYSVNLRMGWLHYLNGDFIRSQTFYKRAISLEPSSIEALLGYIYPTSALQNWDDVLKTYQKIISIDPNNSTALYQAAYIFFLRKNYKKSKTYLNRILKMYPFDYSSNALLGTVYLKSGKITKARKVYEKALENSPQSKEIKEALKSF